jgi:hypothetical protein
MAQLTWPLGVSANPYACCLSCPVTLHNRHNSSSHRHARAPALARHLPRRRCATARWPPATSLRPLYAINQPLVLQVITPESTALGTPTSLLRTRLAPAMQGRDAGKRTIQHSTAKLASADLHEYTPFHSWCTLLVHLLLASARGNPSIGIGSIAHKTTTITDIILFLTSCFR